MEKQTITFTARSSTNPERVATLTISGEELYLDLSGSIMEGIQKGLAARDEEDGSWAGGLVRFIRPLGAFLIQQGLNTFPIEDASGSVKGGAFTLMLWTRLAGLRLAPVFLRWGQVDNPEGAEAFCTELTNRKSGTLEQPVSKGAGSYWGTWVFGGFIVAVLVKKILFPGKKKENES